MIFDNATIITMNPQRQILLNGAVAITGNQFVAVSHSKDVVAQYPAKRRIDCQGHVLMPGLIDTHVHTAQAMLRGCADDLGLLDWLVQRIWPLRGTTPQKMAAPAPRCACWT
jgi:cytosine/adenosine deaminase-related metal-dependent hydrolase